MDSDIFTSKIVVKAFGLLSEKLNASEITMEITNDINEFVDELNKKYPQLKELQFNIAVNKKIVQHNVALKVTDEIALLPPFSGG
ncbi:MAG TPA: MoaD/ThiS family protein [Bacteroidia bacterium]|nr:MoaD/ThiS family protein [Bacteroidia bacterium]